MPKTQPIATVSVERLPLADALARMGWVPGEHVTLVGPTGVGKTELAIKLLETRHWTLYLSTKRIDATADSLKKMGYKTIRKAIDLNPDVASHYTFAPKWHRKIDNSARLVVHKKEYGDVLTRAFWQTGWTVCIDELEYLNRDLKVQSPIDLLLRQGRSQANSMILGTQRPRYVTLHAYEQATHLFLWRQSDFGNTERAAELTGIDRREVVAITRDLGHHDVFYVNTVTGDRFVTNTRWI